MRTRTKQRQLFLTQAVTLLLNLGAQQDTDQAYRFTLPTKAGLLRLHPDDYQTEGLGTVFSRFDDPQAARQLVDCNPHSGKWNHHYFGGWTLQAALTDLSTQLRRVLI